MNFSHALRLLEDVRADLEYGQIEEARRALSEMKMGLRKKEDAPSTRMRAASPSPSGGSAKRPMIRKVRPGILDKQRKGPAKDPDIIQFKSLLRDWRKKRTESGGKDDSPEALGGFLHRHFGHKNWSVKRATEIARKAHKVDPEFARKAAEHYYTLNKGKPTAPDPQPQPSHAVSKVK